MRRRSNLLVLIGLVAVVIGSAVVYLIAADDDDGVATATEAGTADVVFAKENLASGSLGDDILTNGLYEIRTISTANIVPGALTSPSELSNQILNATFPKGEQILRSGLRPQSLLSQQVTVPDGLEAVAVNVPFLAGGAGYIAPGDRVNIFAVVTTPAATTEVAYTVPRVELLLTNVDVLDVSQQIAPNVVQTPSTDPAAPAAPRTQGGTLTVLLAVGSADAEKVIFASSMGGNSIYLSRVNAEAPPAPPTPGQDFGSILVTEAIEAYQQSHP